MKEMSGTYKVFVKNGDYGYNSKDEYGVTDYVAEHQCLPAALKDFLEWLETSDTKVVMSFRPAKKEKQ